MVTAIERSLVRLRREDQRELVAILNAMLMQLESGHPVRVVLDHPPCALLARAQHRGVDYDRLLLAKKLKAPTQHGAGRR
jgi:uncharacterized protein (DUF2249 family)